MPIRSRRRAGRSMTQWPARTQTRRFTCATRWRPASRISRPRPAPPRRPSPRAGRQCRPPRASRPTPDRAGGDRAAAGPNDDRRRHPRLAERGRARARRTATPGAHCPRRVRACRARPRELRVPRLHLARRNCAAPTAPRGRSTRPSRRSRGTPDYADSRTSWRRPTPPRAPQPHPHVSPPRLAPCGTSTLEVHRTMHAARTMLLAKEDPPARGFLTDNLTTEDHEPVRPEPARPRSTGAPHHERAREARPVPWRAAPRSVQ
jgi:hypothetical protein